LGILCGRGMPSVNEFAFAERYMRLDNRFLIFNQSIALFSPPL
jgi:hypothetical protein